MRGAVERPAGIEPRLWEGMRPEQREVAVHIDGEYRRYYLRGMLAERNVRVRHAMAASEERQ